MAYNGRNIVQLSIGDMVRPGFSGPLQIYGNKVIEVELKLSACGVKRD